MLPDSRPARFPAKSVLLQLPLLLLLATAEAPADPAFARKVDALLQKTSDPAQIDAMLAEAEQKLLKSPKQQGYLEAVGLLHHRLGRWENARRHLIRLEKPSAKALASLAKCHFELGEYRRASLAMGRSGDPSRSQETWLLYALSLQKAGRSAEAAAQWEKYRQRHAAPPEALDFLAEVYRRPGPGNKEKLAAVLEDRLRGNKGTPEEADLLRELYVLYPLAHARAAEHRAAYLKLRPEDYQAWAELASAYETQKDIPRAAQAYRKAAPHFTYDGPFLRKAAAAVAKSDPAAGASLYAQCLPLLPRDAEAALELGRLQEVLKRPDLALEAYTEALRRAPGLAEAKGKVSALAPAAKGDAALAAMVEAEKSNPKDHAFQFEIAKALAARGDTAEAFRYLDRAIRQAPSKREYRPLLTRVLTEDGPILRHFPALEALRKEGDSSPELLALLCRGYALLKNHPQAAEAARALLQRDPGKAAGLRQAVLSARAAKDAPLTLKLAENYLARHPKDGEVRRLHVSAAFAANAPPEKQRQAIQALMAQDPSEDEWLLRLAELDLQARDSAAAFRHAEAWTRVHPEDPKGQALVHALSRGRKGREGSYLASLDRLARADTSKRAHYELEIAQYYLESGEPGKAAEIMGRMASLLKNDAAFWHRYGSALEKLGRESAPQALERAYRLDPRPEYALGWARVMAGDSSLAANLPVLRAALQTQAGAASLPLRLKFARACYLAGNAAAAADEWETLSKRDPALAVDDTLAALAFLKAGRLARAVALLEQRAAQYPRETRPLALLAEIYEREGRRADKVRVLERLAQEDFALGDHALRLAKEKEQAGAWAEAVRIYSLWSLRHPQDRETPKALRRVALAAKDTLALLEALRLLTRFEGADRAHRMEQAELFYQRGGDPAELEKLVREFPDYRQGRLMLVREYQSKGDMQNLQRFEAFLESESRNDGALLEPLGDLRASQGKWEEALKAYFAWLSVRPKDADVFAKVLAFARQRQSPYLVSILRMGTERDPEDLGLRAQYAEALGKTPSALAVYESLLQKRKDDLALLTSAAPLARDLGRKDLALRWYQDWARLDAKDERPWQALADLHTASGDRNALASALTGLQSLRGGNGELAMRLGRLREELGHWELALGAYRAALYLNPTDKAVREKAIALLRRPDLREQAPDFLAEIQALDSGAHEAQFELARLQVQKGQREKAYAYLGAALEKSPRHPHYLGLLPQAIHSREQILRHFEDLLGLEKNPALNRSDTASLPLFLHLARGFALKQKWEDAAGRYAAVHRLRPAALAGDREALIAAFKGKNWPLAADLSERYFAAKPDFDKEVLQVQILAYEKTGKGDAAIRQALRQLLAFDRENAGGLLRLAELDLRARDTAAARAHIRQCLMTNPGETRAYRLLLPLVEGRAEHRVTYVVVLEKLAQLDTAGRAVAWRKLADFYEGRKNFRETHRYLSLLVVPGTKDPALWFRLGKARGHIQVGDLGVGALRQAWELSPENLEYARTFAQTLRNPEEIRSNLPVLKFLDARGPTLEETRLLARSHLYGGDAAASAAAWDRVLRQPEERAKPQMEAAEAYWRTEQWAKALPHYELRLPRELQPLPVLDTLHFLYGKLNLEDKRVKVLHHLVRIDAGFKDFQLLLARALESRGEAREALAQYGLWTARKPGDAEPLRSMRRLADSLRDSAALESALRQLVALKKPHEDHVRQLAELDYRLSGDVVPLEKAVKAYPGFTRGRVLLAREYHRRDEVPKMAPFEPELAAEATRDPLAQEALGDLYAFQNKKDKANAAYLTWLSHRRESLRRRHDAHPGDFRAALEKTWSYASATASPTLPTVLGLGYEALPEAPVAHALGEALGNTPKALVFYQQWLKSHPEDAGALPRAADVALRLGEWAQARAWCRKWVEMHPVDLAGWKGLRLAGEKLGDAATQIAALERLADLQPGDAAMAHALGTLLAAGGDRVRSLEYLVRASDLKPADKAYAREVKTQLEKLGDAALKEGIPQAAQWFGLLLEREPGHRRANLVMGLAMAQAQDPGAAPLLRSGLKGADEPSALLAQAYRALGQAEAALGQPGAAAEAFQKAVTLDPKEATAALGWLEAVQALGRQADLPAAYAAVLRADSGHADALAGLAALRLAAGAYSEAERLLRKLAALRPEDPQVFVDGAAALQAMERTQEAQKALAKAYGLGDRRPEVVGGLVRLHRKNGSLREAMPVLEEWLRQSPDDDEAAAWAAELAEQAGDARRAEEMWALAWQAQPGQMRYLEGLARSYVRRGDPEYAADLLQPHSSQLGADGLHLLGEAYAAAGDGEKALEAYRKSAAKKPSGRAAAGIVLVLLERKRPEEARRLLEKSGGGDPEVEKARVRLHLLLRDSDKALALAKALAAAQPRDAEAQRLLGEAFLSRRDGEGALRASEAARKLDTAYYHSLYLAGRAYLSGGKTAEARSAFFALGEKSDRRARALGLLGLGELSLQGGRGEEAKDYWMQAAFLQPTPLGLSQLAALCLRLGQVDEAEALAQRALEMVEDYPDAVSALAGAMLARSRAQEAREYVEEVLQKNPSSCELLQALGRAHMAKDDIQALAALSEKARRACPDDPLPWYFAGMAAAKTEKARDAAAHFSRYKQLGGAADKVPQGF